MEYKKCRQSAKMVIMAALCNRGAIIQCVHEKTAPLSIMV